MKEPSDQPADSGHAIDVHVGKRLRHLRHFRGKTQQEIAEALGITFQQIQKYERGMSRISCRRLYRLAQVLTVPVGSFFEGLPDPVSDEAKEFYSLDELTLRQQRMLSEIIAIESPELFDKLAALVKTLNKSGPK